MYDDPIGRAISGREKGEAAYVRIPLDPGVGLLNLLHVAHALGEVLERRGSACD